MLHQLAARPAHQEQVKSPGPGILLNQGISTRVTDSRMSSGSGLLTSESWSAIPATDAAILTQTLCIRLTGGQALPASGLRGTRRVLAGTKKNSRLAPEAKPPGPDPRECELVAARPDSYVAPPRLTGEPGRSLAKMGRPSVADWACSAVPSELEVGCEGANTITLKNRPTCV
jgi:hypothetical protein